MSDQGILSDNISTYLIDNLIVMDNSHQVLVGKYGQEAQLGPSYSSDKWRHYCINTWPSVHSESIPLAQIKSIGIENAEAVNELVFPLCWHSDHHHYWHFIFDIAFRVYYLKTVHPDLISEITFLVIGRESLSPFQESIIKAILGYLPPFKYVSSCATCKSAIYIPPVNTLLQKGEWLREYSTSLKCILTEGGSDSTEHTKLSAATESKLSRIYLSRGSARNPRFIINEQELLKLLQHRGFKPNDPGSLSIESQALLFNGADVVLGMHGAAFTNMIFMEKNKCIAELTHSLYDPPTLFILAKQLGIHHVRLCRNVGNLSGRPHSSFSVDLGMVQRWMDRSPFSHNIQ